MLFNCFLDFFRSANHARGSAAQLKKRGKKKKSKVKKTQRGKKKKSKVKMTQKKR